MKYKLCPKCRTMNSPAFTSCSYCKESLEGVEPVEIADKKIDGNDTRGKNSIASILRFFAIATYILGFVAGLLLGIDAFGYSFLVCVLYWLGSFVAGTIMYGFSEIIRLLQIISEKQ